MPKSSRRRKLTKEELQEENARIRKEMNEAGEDQSAQVMNVISKNNFKVYIMLCLVPLVGIWYMYAKKDKHTMSTPAMYTWTVLALVIFWQQCIQIFIPLFNGTYFDQFNAVSSAIGLL